MGAKSARKYKQQQAERIVTSVQTIIDRLNKKYIPLWLYKELNIIHRNSQSIEYEFRQIMRDHIDADTIDPLTFPTRVEDFIRELTSKTLTTREKAL